MQAGLKVVDKFQFYENQVRQEDGVQIIPAKHTVLKEQFTLKKLNLKDSNKNRYQTLINQITILKEAHIDYLIKCHKMLKTTNNLYLVYDYITGNTLKKYFQSHKFQITYQQKQSITKQLVNILYELKKKHIVHLNLNPSIIEVTENAGNLSNQNISLKIVNFQYGINLNKPLDHNIINSIPVSEYVAKEVKQNHQNIGFHSDIFSLGKVLQFLQMGKHKKSESGLQTNRKTLDKSHQLQKYVVNMLSDNYQERIEVEILMAHFSELKGVKSATNLRKQNNKTSVHRSGKDINISINFTRGEDNRSQISNQNRSRITSESNPSNIYPDSSTQITKKCCQKIIKKRNLAILLMKFSQSCLKLRFAHTSTTIIAAFIFIKKSTIVISQLAKFLYGSRNDSDIKIPERDLKLFFRTPDYFKLQSIVSKQMNIQKRYLNQMVEQITLGHPHLLRNEQFNQELSKQKINEQFFKLSIIKFLQETCRQRRASTIDSETLAHLAVISYVLDFGTYEKMAEDLLNEDILQLQSQPLFIKIGRLQPQKIIQKILQALNS